MGYNGSSKLAYQLFGEQVIARVLLKWSDGCLAARITIGEKKFVLVRPVHADECIEDFTMSLLFPSKDVDSAITPRTAELDCGNGVTATLSQKSVSEMEISIRAQDDIEEWRFSIIEVPGNDDFLCVAKSDESFIAYSYSPNWDEF